MRIMDPPLVRLMVTALLALKALDDFFATTLTIAHRIGALGVAERLGRVTPGDDYRRLVPLMEAVPMWLHGLWVIAGILYLLAIASVVRRTGGAHILVLVAVGIELVALVVGRPIVAATGVVVNPNLGGLADVVRFILPLLLALVLWQSGRRTSASIPASR
ncbi:MAG: hypothetical protein ABIG68_12420 [Acidobacteriota bacterium]